MYLSTIDNLITVLYEVGGSSILMDKILTISKSSDRALDYAAQLDELKRLYEGLPDFLFQVCVIHVHI